MGAVTQTEEPKPAQFKPPLCGALLVLLPGLLPVVLLAVSLLHSCGARVMGSVE